RRAELVREVGALVGNALMHTRDLAPCFGFVATPLQPTAEGALRAAELARTPAIETRSGYPWPRAGHHGVPQPQVQPHGALGIGERQRDDRHLGFSHQ